jgi:hypothetical protein
VPGPLFERAEIFEISQILGAKLPKFSPPEGISDFFGGTLETYREIPQMVQGGMNELLKPDEG